MPTRIPVPFLNRRRESSNERTPPSLRDNASIIAANSTAGALRRRNIFGSQPKQGQLGHAASSADLETAEKQKSPSASAFQIENDSLQTEGLHMTPLHDTAKPTPQPQCTDLPRPGHTKQQEPVKHRHTWKKLLYIKQDYPDDYVDETFLMELQKNTNVQLYDYSAIALQTCVVTQHISSIMVFIAIFINLYRGSLAGDTLLYWSLALTVLGFVSWDFLSMFLHIPEQRILRFSVVKGALFIVFFLFGLSPVLRTLTEDTSSDTIWAMTVLFFCVNLAFHDYSTGNLSNIRFPGSVSLNAAVLASVLLASQLDNNLSVFAFLAFSLQWFALFPIFRRYLKRISVAASTAVTVMLALVATAMFAYILRPISMLFVFITLFITFGCPLWLIWVQRYKNEIHGPWDEARPIVHHYYH
ncbi:glycosylphosphatidylinositol anchor biosynthesis [Coemansia erecta]|nr:glycosylphosphatidylinositol anchor biosynthesis [Coemansia erecta]